MGPPGRGSGGVSNGSYPGQVKHSKPPPEVTMGAFDVLPETVRREIAEHNRDVDPRIILAMIEIDELPESRVIEKLRKHGR